MPVHLNSFSFLSNAASLRGGAIFTDSSSSLRAVNITVSNNVASAYSTNAPQGESDYGGAGGGMYILGTVLLFCGRVFGNEAPHALESANIFNGANMTYILPGPQGYYMDGVFACGKATCFHPVLRNDPRFPGYVIPCPHQPCDATLITQNVSVLREGSIAQDLPTPCNPGFYANSTDTSSQNSALCVGICPAGFTCPNASTIEPIPAEQGFYSSAGAMEPSNCSRGTFGTPSLLPGGRTSLESACDPCPFNTTTLFTGQASAGACVCQPSFFDDLSRSASDAIDKKTGARRCSSCPLGFDCNADEYATNTSSANVTAGFWRPSIISARSKPCPHPDLCKGGPSEFVYDHDSTATCKHKHKGAYCLECVDSREYLDTTRVACDECSNALGFVGAVIGSFVGFLILTALIAALVTREPRPPSNAGLLQRLRALLGASRRALVVCLRRMWDHPCSLRVRSASAAVTLPVKCKLLLSFSQVLAQIHDTYRIREPNSYHYQSLTQKVFSPVRLELFGWIPGLHSSCLGIKTLQSKLLLYSLLPLGVVVVAFALSAVRTRNLMSALPVVLRVTYLFYPSVASKGFQTLAHCECFDQVNATALCFLPADYSVPCVDKSAPSYLLASGWVAVVLGGIGVPLLYAALLFSCRDTIRQEAKTPLSEALTFLHESLNSWALYWPLVETARALTLTGFLALAWPGTMLQLLCGLLVAMSFLILQMWCAPYRTASNNFLAVAVDASLVLNFISSVGVQVNSLYDGHVDEMYLSIALYAAAFTVFIIVMLSFLLSLGRQPAGGAPSFGSAQAVTAASTNTAAEELLGDESREAAINTA
jgi:hypothetical protein